MFGKKVNTDKLNETLGSATKVLNILHILLIVGLLYVVIIIFRETKIFDFIKTILKVVSPLFIGLVIAWLFDPFVNLLERKGIKRIWGSIITYVIIILVFAIVMSALAPLIVSQVKDFVKTLPSVLDSIKGFINGVFDKFGKSELININKVKGEFFGYIEGFAMDVTTTMPSNFLGFVSKLISWVGSLILGFIIGFFLILNFDSLHKLINFVPKKHQEVTYELLSLVNGSFRSYVKGAVIDCVLIFVLSSIALWLCGLKSPALFGLFCALTNFIPYAGPYIGGVPAVVVGFTQNVWVGIFSIVSIFIIQFVEGNFLQPLIMSKTTKLHPVTIILGLLIFGHFFGIIGMLVSTPVIAAIKTIFKFYNDRYNIIKESHAE
ncbi:MAG: AI-2E family transporter [Bacilli bacterium]|nr:AI-2E family transporter [Bacilli bacterium]